MYNAKDRTYLLKNHLKSVLGAASQQSITVRGRHWHWLSAGNPRAREAVVLLHGMSMSKDHWRSVMAALSSDYFVVAPDVPGLKLDQPATDPDAGFAGIARELADFLSVAVGRPVHLVGHSMAATLALGLSVRMPVPVLSITLVSLAEARFTEELSVALNVKQMSEFIEHMTEAQHLEYLRSMFYRPPASLKLLAKSNWLGFSRGKDRCVALLRGMEEELARIDDDSFGPDVPCLVVTGREDPWNDLTRNHGFFNRSHITRIELEGCRHLPFLERPRDFACAIRAFIGQADRRRPPLQESDVA